MSKIIRLDGSWLTSYEASEIMGCSVRYLHRLNYLGVLKPVKVGRACLYRRKDIERYVEAHPRLGKAVAAS